MPFLPNARDRAASWLADRLGLRRLFAATSYLLVQQLNTDPPLEGPEANRCLQQTFLSLFRTLQPSLFLDVGANDGSASIAVREVAPACPVHAFEANPQIYAANKSTLEQHGVRFWNLAVSDHLGRATVYAPRTLSRAYVGGEVVPAAITERENTGKTSLLRRNEDATYAEFQVPATTLDAFVNTHVSDWHDRTAFLWIDVEGAGDRVLAGAKSLLSRTRVIFLETEGFDFWQDQADCGTVVTRLIRAGFLPLARDREYGDKQFNILFVHQDAVGQILPRLFDCGGLLRPRGATGTDVGEKPQASEVTPLRKPHVSLGVALQSDIPVIIPCFNASTYARGMVEQLRALGLRQLFLVDNASTYPAMREYLAAPGPGVTVIAQAENKGPRDTFLDPAQLALLPTLFCITDPDLVFNTEMPPDFLAQLAALTEQHSVGKAGFAIDIADRATMRENAFRIGDRHYKIWEWEAQFWQEPLAPLPGGDPVFKAPIDTSFALYNKRFFSIDDPLKAVRVAGRFTCRHLPWYKDTGLPPEEERFYRTRARDSFYMRSEANPDQTTRYEREPDS